MLYCVLHGSHLQLPDDPQVMANDPQVIANILWAYATRGVMPGEKLIGQVSVLVLCTRKASEAS